MSTATPTREPTSAGAAVKVPPEERFWQRYSPHGEAPLSMAGIGEPGKNFSSLTAKDLLVQKNQLLRQHLEDERLRFQPLSADRLKVFNHQQLSKRAI